MQSIDTLGKRHLWQIAIKPGRSMTFGGNRYSLCRKISDHARRDNLTLDEVEHILERWKLEGPHGG